MNKTFLILCGASLLFNFVLVFFYARLAKAYTYAVRVYKKAMRNIDSRLWVEDGWKNKKLWKAARKKEK